MRGVEVTRIVSTQDAMKTRLALIIYIAELHMVKNFQLPWLYISLYLQ